MTEISPSSLHTSQTSLTTYIFPPDMFHTSAKTAEQSEYQKQIIRFIKRYVLLKFYRGRPTSWDRIDFREFQALIRPEKLKLCTQMQHLCTRKKNKLQRYMCFSVNFSKSYRDAKSLQRCTTVQLHSLILRYITVALCKNHHTLWRRKFCTVFTLYITY